ncbi:hypothetical protein DFH11DRAFT_1726307 [Phellopilus nigrolimitatus]|nr:hypothetical protein DFH11DRAFT_1726307 [Phellopilus nigrolimitatus]
MEVEFFVASSRGGGHPGGWDGSRPARHVNDEIDEIDKLPIANRPASPHKSFDSLFRNLNNTQLSASSEPGPTSPAVANMNDPFRTQVLPPNTKNSAPSTPDSSITAASHSSAGPPSIKQLISETGSGDPSQGSYPQSAPLPYPPQSYGPFPQTLTKHSIPKSRRATSSLRLRKRSRNTLSQSQVHARSAVQTVQRHVCTLLRKSKREEFLAHFDTLELEAPLDAGDSGGGDILHRMEREFALLKTFHPNSRQDDAPAFMTWHPPLLEAHFSILNCLLMLGEFAALARRDSPRDSRAIRCSSRRAPWCMRTPRFAEPDVLRMPTPLPVTEEDDPAACPSAGPSMASSSSKTLKNALDVWVRVARCAWRARADARAAAREGGAGARGRGKWERAGAENARAPLNLTPHGTRVELILAWLGAVHFPALGAAAAAPRYSDLAWYSSWRASPATAASARTRCRPARDTSLSTQRVCVYPALQPGYVAKLSSELANKAQTTTIRNAAGIAFKNALSAHWSRCRRHCASSGKTISFALPAIENDEVQQPLPDITLDSITSSITTQLALKALRVREKQRVLRVQERLTNRTFLPLDRNDFRRPR